jgi:hypothetical protein
MTLASAPEELVEGMASFLREVGVNNSYIDNDELKARGEKEPLWLFLQRNLINPLSFGHQIFQYNLAPLR